MPLAINAMAQPSGRVCGFHPRYRFYLRSSPIVCVADLVAFLVKFVTFSWNRRSIRKGLKRAMSLRELHAESDSIGAQAIGKLPLPRLVLFTLAMVQALNLLVYNGIATTLWTRLWACSYLVPYFCYEALGIVGKWIEGERLDTSEADVHARARQLMHAWRNFDHFLGLLALAAQWIVIFMLLHGLVNPSDPGAVAHITPSAANVAFLQVLLNAPVIHFFYRAPMPRRDDSPLEDRVLVKWMLVCSPAVAIALLSYCYIDSAYHIQGALSWLEASLVLLSSLSTLAVVLGRTVLDVLSFATAEGFLVPSQGDAN